MATDAPGRLRTPSAALASVPAGAWLAGIVLASFALRAWLARGMQAPFIMVDELIYAELAKSFAADGSFSIRDYPGGGYGALYPILISPAYAYFDRLPDAYAAVKTINSLLMSLAAVPGYLLARRVVAPAWALVAALLVVAVPSLVYTATVMTENAYYPAFLLAALLLVRLLERPTVARQLVFFGGLGIAMLVRAQSVAIAAAALTAPFLLAALARRPLRELLRPLWPLYALLAGGVVAAAAAQAARGRDLRELLGAYAVVGESGYDVGRALEFLLLHLAELSLYLGVVPLVATALLVGRARSLDPPLQALLTATLALATWFLLLVATFASRFADRIQERNIFVLAPLFVVCLVAWVERGAPRRRGFAAAAALAGVLVVAAIPFERYVTRAAVSDTLMLLPFGALGEELGRRWMEWAALALLAVLAAAAVLLPRRRVALLPAALLAYWLAALVPIWWGAYPFGFRDAGAGARFQGIPGQPRDWIDSAVPDGAEVAVLYTGRADRFTVNLNEFFNRSVGPVYYTDAPTPGGDGRETRVAREPDASVRTEDGTALAPRYLLADGTAAVAGDARLLASNAVNGIRLWQLDGPLVLAEERVTGVDDDTWSRGVVRWTRRPCEGGTLTVLLAGDAQLHPRGNRVSSGGRSVRVPPPPSPPVTLTVPLRARGGACSARFTVTPTAVPAESVAGSSDERELGVHFVGFGYER